MSRRWNSFLILIIALVLKANGAFAVICNATDAYSTTVCADSPSEYLRLGELFSVPASQTAVDASGNGNVGSYNGVTGTSIVTGQLGINGACGNPATSFNPVADPSNSGHLELCGSGSEPTCTSATSTFLSPVAASTWTLEFWLKWTALPCVSGTQSLFQKLNANLFTASEWQAVGTCGGGNNGIGWQICQQNTFCTTYMVADTTGFTNMNSTTDFYHVVITWDAGTTTSKMYVNGSLASTVSSTTGTPANQAAPFFAMVRLNNALFDSPGFAIMDEITFYTSVLNSTRILAHYNSGVAACSGGDNWPFNVKVPESPKECHRNYQLIDYSSGMN